MKFLFLILTCLPAFIANLTPYLAEKSFLAEELNIPIDRDREIKKKRIIGRTKTWRGVLISMLTGGIVASVEVLLFPNLLLFTEKNIYFAIVFGALAGLGVSLGDVFGSFFKRRFSIASGEFVPVLDQADYILGFFAFTFFTIKFSAFDIFFVVTFAIFVDSMIRILTGNLKKSNILK